MYTVDSKDKYSLTDYWSEVFSHRSLMLALVRRRLKIKYASTFLGVLWVLIQPLILIFLLVTVFSKVADLPTDGNQSALAFTTVGLITWLYFSTCLSGSVSSSMSSQDLMKKVYFPRALVPISVSVESTIELLLILFLSLLVGGFSLGAHLFALPAYLLWLIIFTSASNHIVVMLTLRFNDLKFVLPVVTRILLFTTPISYSSNVLTAKGYGWLAQCNPLVGLIEAARYCATGFPANIDIIYSGLLWTLVMVSVVLWGFMRFDRVIGDIV